MTESFPPEVGGTPQPGGFGGTPQPGGFGGTPQPGGRQETGGPSRTPRSEIGPAVSANRKKEPVLLLDLSTSMDCSAADENGPGWPDQGSRRAIGNVPLLGLELALQSQDNK